MAVPSAAGEGGYNVSRHVVSGFSGLNTSLVYPYKWAGPVLARAVIVASSTGDRISSGM